MNNKFVWLILLLCFIIPIVGCAQRELRQTEGPDKMREQPSNSIESNVEDGMESGAEKLGFSGGNIGAGGLMGGDGNGVVYYRSEANWNLYRARLDGTEKTKLNEDYPADINVLNGWVYYSNYLDGFSLYRVRTDGRDRERLVDGYCCNLYVAENGLYFDMRDENNSAQVYRADLDGSDMKLLVPNMNVAYYYGGIVYCCNIKKLCAFDLEIGKLTTLCEKYTYNVSVDDTGIYYWAVDENAFCRMTFNGEEVKVLVTGGDFFNYTAGKLYYSGYGGDNYDYFCIYCLDVETGETKTVLSLSDQYFDAQGNLLGVTIAQLRDGTVEWDESRFGNEEGVFEGYYSEQPGYTYVIEDHSFCRGTLRNSIFETGKLDCLILYDGAGGIVWD